jgi:hypothetical protein
VLDHRSGSDSPIIVVNEPRHEGNKVEVDGREITPSVEEVWEILNLPKSTQKAGFVARSIPSIWKSL